MAWRFRLGIAGLLLTLAVFSATTVLTLGGLGRGAGGLALLAGKRFSAGNGETIWLLLLGGLDAVLLCALHQRHSAAA